jgi:hypothetical protein
MKGQEFWKAMWGDINESLIYDDQEDVEVPMYTTEAPDGTKIDLRRDAEAAPMIPSSKLSDEDDDYLASLLGD